MTSATSTASPPWSAAATPASSSPAAPTAASASPTASTADRRRRRRSCGSCSPTLLPERPALRGDHFLRDPTADGDPLHGLRRRELVERGEEGALVIAGGQVG